MNCIFCGIPLGKNEFVCADCVLLEWTEEDEKFEDEYIPPTKRESLRDMRRLRRLISKSKLRLILNSIHRDKRIRSLLKQYTHPVIN